MNASRLILIIEDDEDIRASYREVLEELGHEVREAHNGRRGIEVLGSMNPLPDLIFFDHMMPVLDGYGFRKEQLAQQQWKDIPVVVSTAGSLKAEDFALLNANAYLKKPTTVEQMENVLEDLLSMKAASLQA